MLKSLTNPPITRLPLFEVTRRLLGSGLLPLALFLVVFLLSLSATDGPRTLGISGTPCDDGWCISEVFPASAGWVAGLRPGQTIVSVEGDLLDAADPPADWSSVGATTVVAENGRVLTARVDDPPHGDSPLKISLWALAGGFAVLGSLVQFRRPDLPSAVAFGLFSAITAVALAIAPATGAESPPWSLMVQAYALLGSSYLLFEFLYRLAVEQGTELVRWGRFRRLFQTFTVVVMASYTLVALAAPRAYEYVRSGLVLVMVIGLVASIVLLLVASRSLARRGEGGLLRVPFYGLAGGFLPFLTLTLVPDIAGRGPFVAVDITVLPIVLVPTSFAYAILRSQLWGIRRLVHRGLVYALVSVVLLSFVVAGITLANRISDTSETSVELILAGVLVVVGISVYRPLVRGARGLVDRVFYTDTPSYSEFVRELQQDLNSVGAEGILAVALGQVLCQRLGLESMVLLGTEEDGAMVVKARYGEGARAVIGAVDDGHLRPPDASVRGPTIVRLGADQVVATHLLTNDRLVGTLLLGPKEGGELFVSDEINLILGAAPFIAMALDRDELSGTMRQLNRRLVETEERERARMAIDLHDGPLQKAVALAWDRDYAATNPTEVAKELVNELREFGSRLRPSILDDLGLPSSLEWLLASSLRSTGIEGHLELIGLDEDTRLPSEVELALFRVTQESLNNAVKHSSASEMHACLRLSGDALTLTVRDNGVGIGGAGSGRIPSSRLGMVGMRERVMQVGGDLSVESKPGMGVTIEVTVPMTEETLVGIREQHDD